MRLLTLPTLLLFRLVLKEGGLCDYYSICLSSKPTSTVEISVEKGMADLEIDPVKLIIFPDKWDDIQTIKVRAVDHPGSDGFSWTTEIRHTVKSEDTRYQSPRCTCVPQSISITVMENDAPYLFSFGDSEYGQTGLNHLELQSTPKYVNFKLAMNVPLDPHTETLSDRNSNRIKDTTRPWHTTTNKKLTSTRPTAGRPSKASTSMMLRRILEQNSQDTFSLTAASALTASEEIAQRRAVSAAATSLSLSRCRSTKNTHKTDKKWGKIITAVVKTEEGVPPHVGMSTVVTAIIEATAATVAATAAAARTNIDPTVTSAEAERQLLTTLFPAHKTLNDHQNTITEQEKNRYKRKKRIALHDIHGKKRKDREDRKKLHESKFPPPSHISVLSCGLDHSALVTGDGRCYTWGKGISGNLGLGEHANRRIPQ